MVNSIGTTSDATEERKQFLLLRSNVNSKLEQATSVAAKMHNVRAEVENELGHYVKQFRTLVQTATDKFSKTKPYKARSRNEDLDVSSESIPLLTKVSYSNGNSNLSTVKDLQQQLQTHVDVGNVDIQDESKLLEEHTEKMYYVKEELSQMKGLFEDMDYLIDSQQPEVDMLSQTVINIKDNAQQGIKHISKAANYAATAGRNRCLLLLFLLVVSFVLGTFIWTVNKRHQGGKG